MQLNKLFNKLYAGEIEMVEAYLLLVLLLQDIKSVIQVFVMPSLECTSA